MMDGRGFGEFWPHTFPRLQQPAVEYTNLFQETSTTTCHFSSSSSNGAAPVPLHHRPILQDFTHRAPIFFPADYDQALLSNFGHNIPGTSAQYNSVPAQLFHEHREATNGMCGPVCGQTLHSMGIRSPSTLGYGKVVQLPSKALMDPCSSVQHVPVSSSSHPAVSITDISHRKTGCIQACQVCLAASSNGLHFGAKTCAACAAFFRRTVSDQKRYICKRSHRCGVKLNDVTGYRKICRSCRMKRCLDVGMLPENVQTKRHKKEVTNSYLQAPSGRTTDGDTSATTQSLHIEKDSVVYQCI